MFIREVTCTDLVDHSDCEDFEVYDSQFDGARTEYHVFGVFSDEAALQAVEAINDADSLRATQLRHGVYEVVACSF